jgi:hypothetical protein
MIRIASPRSVCASLFRQFEFVQQQWINYGLDANAGHDTCPLVGNHSDGTGTTSMTALSMIGMGVVDPT